MKGGPRAPRQRFPRAGVLGIALVLIAPALWVALPFSGLWESVGPPTASSAGTQSVVGVQFGSALAAYVIYDSNSQTAVASFFGDGESGEILFLNGTSLSSIHWLSPDCNPASMADDSATGQVVVLCQLASLDWELLTISPSSHAVVTSVPLPGGNLYYSLEQIALDPATDVAYVVQEPPNASNPQHVVGVQATTGALIANLTVTVAHYEADSELAVGPTPGTLFWMDRDAGEVQLLNSTSGAVLATSPRVGTPYQVIYYDPATADLFLSNETSGVTTLVSAENLSVVGSLPDDARGGVQTDSQHGETYLYGPGVVSVVRSSGWAPVGTIATSVFLDGICYDPAVDKFVGAESGEVPAAEWISISRAPVIGASFSSVPGVGSSLSSWLAGTALLVGVVLVVATRRLIVAALKERRAEREREFARWIAEPSVVKWNPDGTTDQRKD